MNGLVPYARGQNSYTQFPNVSLAHYPQNTNLAAPAPSSSLSSFRDWWRELRMQQVPVESAGPVQSAVVGLRQNAESAAIGALLAFIDSDLGGLDLGGRIPLDWAGAALFYILSVQGTGNPDSLSLDYRAMGQSCTSVAMYRTVHKWRDAKKGIPRNTPQLSGDPVLSASAGLNSSKKAAF
jgi:hypothetical protein